MALSENQKEAIRILVSSNYKTTDNPNGLSNRAIAKDAGCSESAVRSLIKKEGIEKNAINALAKQEVDTTIKQQKIKNAKNALSNAQKDAYNVVFLDEAQRAGLATSNHNRLLMGISNILEAGTKETKVNAGDGMHRIEPIALDPNDMVQLSKAQQTVTDSLGYTQRHSAQVALQLNNNKISAEEASESEAITLDEVIAEKPETSEQAQIRYDNAMKKRRGEIK